MTAAESDAPDIIADPYTYIAAQAAGCDAIVPGLGDVLKLAWNMLAPSMFHHIGLMLTATSGAATELDYYTNGDHP